LQISGDEAMCEVHLLRAHHDVIMVGIGTVLSDDPALNVRLPGLEDRSPVRVILDSQLRMPLDGQLMRSARKIPLWIMASEATSVEKEAALKAQGAEVLRVGLDASGHLDLNAVMRLLADRGVTRIFSEGGPSVADALVRRGLADVVILSTSDKALGQKGVAAVHPDMAAVLQNASRFIQFNETRYGSDVFTCFERPA
jgi:diaminohydroxyphosphoribosylaminopyrimidine deaminase / 5-amino-6-(5-phosphoribosylamino)uracil reductase